jgi:Flp pilus assembly protein TadG
MRLPYVRAPKIRDTRRGAAAVELALLLPVLVFCSMMSVDFARVAYVQVTLQNCARNGALYAFYTGMNTVNKAGILVPYSSLNTAVQADAPPYMVNDASFSVVATSPALSTNNYVTVTVTYAFTPIALSSMDGMPSIGSPIILSQSATMPYPASQNAVP